MDNFTIIDYIGAHDAVLGCFCFLFVCLFLNKAKQNNTSRKIIGLVPLQRTQMSECKKILASIVSM